MKILQISLSIAILALATCTYGQQYTMMDGTHPEQSSYMLAAYQEAAPRYLMQQAYSPATVTASSHSKSVDLIYEMEMGVELESIELEPWMIAPFNLDEEPELALETWMCTPFEMAANPEELAVEEWMSTPFYAVR